jgi:excisionase family DNA binding protein
MKADNKQMFLKPIQVAQAIGASRAKVYEMMRLGQIPVVEIGGLLRIPRQALDQLAETAMRSVEDE